MNGPDGDRRGIDLSLGALEGEGAQQRVGNGEAGALQPYDVWRGAASSGPAGGVTTYYERPVLKEPVWIWTVPAYFYLGGAAGAAAVLGAAARALAPDDTRDLVRRSRYLAAAGTAAGTALLIADLGRPERFLNMLRVFKPTSPLNLGSWILSGATGLSVAAAAFGHRSGVLGRLADAAGYGAAVAGVPLAGYTGVLLADTAIPSWQHARRSLPALFVASAAGSAASLLSLTALNDNEERMVRRFGAIAEVAEIAAARALNREVAANERSALPYREGLSGRLWRASSVLSYVSLALGSLSRRSRAAGIAGAAVGSVGGVVTRFAVFHAGKASARDPRAALL